MEIKFIYLCDAPSNHPIGKETILKRFLFHSEKNKLKLFFFFEVLGHGSGEVDIITFFPLFRGKILGTKIEQLEINNFLIL